jgi:hypothetical protein
MSSALTKLRPLPTEMLKGVMNVLRGVSYEYAIAMKPTVLTMCRLAGSTALAGSA